MNSHRPVKRRLILIVIAVALTVTVWSLLPGNRFDRVIRPVTSMLLPVKKGAAELRGQAHRFTAAWGEAAQLRAEYDEVISENAALRRRIEELEYENRKLDKIRKAINIKDRYPHYKVLHANVLSEPMGLWFEAVQADRGTNSGLDRIDDVLGAASFPVVDVNLNLLGRVISADAETAKILFFNAPGSAVYGRADRPDGPHVRVAPDPASGTNIFLVEPASVSSSNVPVSGGAGADADGAAALLEGDIIVTSGQGEFYPPGLVIGRIGRVYEHGGSIRAELEPSAELKSVEDVFILVERQP